MKFTSEIYGLNVISVNEGKKLCKVKDIVINYNKGSLAFFIIDQPLDYLGAKLISFEGIIGMGDYAVTIPDSQVIQDVAHCVLAEELILKDVKIIGSQVLTNKGSLIGEVIDIGIDETSGKIKVCKVKKQNEEILEIDCRFVITYGKEMVIIDARVFADDSTEYQPQKSQQLDSVYKEKEMLKKKIEAFSKNDHLLKAYEENAETQKESPEIPEAGPEVLKDFNIFEQKQLQFLLGKSLAKDVELDNGEFLRAGDTISSLTLQEIKSRNTLMQLTAHVVK